MLTRRDFFRSTLHATMHATMVGLAATTLPGLWPRRAFAADLPAATSSALAQSPLVYVTPLRSDGSESRCQAEVWFVEDGGDVLVVTEPGRWRAAAVEQGLDQARIWVGDFGPWKRANEAWRAAPSFEARAAIDRDTTAHARALEAFGSKYSAEWGKWGPRFRKGLASGSRVLLRYSPTS